MICESEHLRVRRVYDRARVPSTNFTTSLAARLLNFHLPTEHSPALDTCISNHCHSNIDMSAVEEANNLKLRGNEAFAQHDWPTAVECYTAAIEKNGNDASFFCNRAQVSISFSSVTRLSAEHFDL